MKVKTSTFCSLSRHEDWQNWLKDTAKDLYDGLIATLNSHSGCRANSNKMMDIYYELYKRNKGKSFEQFIQSRFPWLIEEAPAPSPQVIRKHIKELKSAGLDKPKPPAVDPSELNKHKVFGYYKPNILSFPQKLILSGSDPQVLYARVQDFLKDKLATDYIILDDRAYLEYYEQKYASVIDRVPRQNREIYKYRQKRLQDGEQNNIIH